MSDKPHSDQGDDEKFEPTIEESTMASGLHQQGSALREDEDNFEPTIEESTMASGLHQQGSALREDEGEDENPS
jgi:hypothetical protein